MRSGLAGLTPARLRLRLRRSRDLGDCYALDVDAMTWRRVAAGGAGGGPGAAPRSAHALLAAACGGVLALGGVQAGRLAQEGPMLLENAAAAEGRALRREALSAAAQAAEAEAARRRTAASAAAAAVEAAAARRDAAHARADTEEAVAALRGASEAQRQVSPARSRGALPLPAAASLTRALSPAAVRAPGAGARRAARGAGRRRRRRARGSRAAL